MARRSLIPYLNERNVPKSVEVSEVVFDHPDPEGFPIAAAPGQHLFGGSSRRQETQTNQFSKIDTFEAQDITLGEKKKNVFLDSTNTAEKDSNGSKNYFEMYRSEHTRRLQLSQEIAGLKHKLSLSKVTYWDLAAG